MPRSKPSGLHRVAPGHYRGIICGREVQVTAVEGHQAWYWLIDGKGGHDWYATKRDAIEAVLEAVAEGWTECVF